MRTLSALSVPVRRLPRFVHQREPLQRERTDIRRRRAHDLAACGRLAGFSVSGGAHPRSWRAWLDADGVLGAWVGERAGEILGHVAVSEVGGDPVSALRWQEVTGHPTGDLLAVSRLFVRPRVRGTGLGAALLRVATAEVRSRGRVPVIEAVGAGPVELRLYESRGWRPVALYSHRQRPDGLDAHFFVLPAGVPLG
jgi:GNAT superfamily N-acetyltransferase